MAIQPVILATSPGGPYSAQRAWRRRGERRNSVATARAQLLFDVTQAYYDAALSDRFVAIAEATLQQSDATVRQVNAAFTAGMQPEFELLRARVSRDTQTPALVRQRANRQIALIRLKQLLDLPFDYDLRLAAALDEALPPQRSLPVWRTSKRWRRVRPARRRSRCHAAPIRRVRSSTRLRGGRGAA